MSLAIAHVLAPAAVGGLESVVRMLAAAQRSRGDRVVVLPVIDNEAATSAPLAHWMRGLCEGGVEVAPIVVSGRRYWRERAEIQAALARFAPDVVHTHGYRADVLAGGAARNDGRAVVTTVHGFIGGDWKNRLYEQLQRRAFRRFDAVVAVSSAMAPALVHSGIESPRLHVVPNAFEASAAPLGRSDARRRLGIGDGFRVGWVGRLSAEKGCDVMMRALASPCMADATLSIIGDGAERPRLERLATRSGIASRISWHGILPSAGTLLRAFDVLVLSSRTEGTPIVLLEAMAAQVPVVATRVGGIPEVIGPEEGLLVEPERPEALALALATVRADRGAASVRATAARARLDELYATGPWVERYASVYETAIRARGSSVR